jgi:iron complex outermembrane receptor protein
MNMPQSARALARRPKASALLALSLLSVLPATKLAAQNNPAPAAPKDEVIVLDAFTVSADNADRYRAADAISAVRVRAPLLDTPSSVSVITRDMMDDIGPNRVFDVTRYVAGVQEGRGVQFQDRMIIRGFETQNGARTVDNFLQSADADNIDESVVDRIEVTKGPNAILSPAGAPGGSLNIITKTPTFRRQNSFNATIGFFDAQKYVLDVGNALNASKTLGYRVVLSGQDSDRYWGNESYIRGSAFAPMVAWKISDKTLLTVKLVAAEHWITREPLFILDPSTTSTSGEPKLLPGISPSEMNGIQPWSHVETHSADLFATLTSSYNEHLSYRLAANTRYFFENDDQDFLNAPGLSNRYNPTTGELTQDYTWAVVNGVDTSTYSPWINPGAISNRGQIQWTRRKTANFQADGVANYQFGDVSSQTVAGLAWSRQYGYSRSIDPGGGGGPGTLPPINLANPHAQAYPNYGSTLTGNNLATYTNEQLFVNQRFGFFGNKLYLTGGLLRYGTRTTSRNAISSATNAILDDSKNMWSASVLYKVRDNVSLYASRSNNASPVIANNAPLWRQGDQDEFGFKSEWFNRKLSLNGAYFKISQTNVTVPNPAFQTDPTQPQTLVSDLSNKGFELELMGSVTSNLSVIATYSHLNMRDALGRMVRGVADNNAALLANFRLADGLAKGLSINAGVVYSGKRAGDVPDGNFTARNVVKKVSFYLEPQYTTTLGFNYQWNETYTTRLTIDNVFDDKDYVSVAGGRISGTGLTTQPGRNVRLTTTINW